MENAKDPKILISIVSQIKWQALMINSFTLSATTYDSFEMFKFGICNMYADKTNETGYNQFDCVLQLASNE